MPFISSKMTFQIPLLLSGGALLAFGKYRERLLVILAVVVIAVGDGGIVSNLKHAFNRPRPYQRLENVRQVSLRGIEITSRPSPYVRGGSMPSGHVANNTAVAWLVFWLYRRWRRLVWAWPALMMYSRVYTGDHYPSDVVIAFLVASIYTYAIALIARRGWQRWAPSIYPKLYEKHSFLFPSADSS